MNKLKSKVLSVVLITLLPMYCLISRPPRPPFDFNEISDIYIVRVKHQEVESMQLDLDDVVFIKNLLLYEKPKSYKRQSWDHILEFDINHGSGISGDIYYGEIDTSMSLYNKEKVLYHIIIDNMNRDRINSIVTKLESKLNN